MKQVTTIFFILAFVAVGRLGAQPSITTPPQSRTNNIGDNAQFSVVATGTGTLTYQWKYNDLDIDGATNSILNVLVTNANQAGTFRVVVSDDLGSAPSSSATLSVPFADRLKITQWDFNSSPEDGNTSTGVLTPSFGEGTASWPLMTLNNWLEGCSSDPASLGTDNSGRSLKGPSTSRTNKTAGAQFDVSTVGYKDIVVTWEQLSNGRACAYWRGQYTTNGSDWVDRIVADMRAPFLALGSTTYVFHSDDLSGVPGVKNNPLFGYRIVGEWESTATGAGADAYVPVDPNDPNGYNASGAHRWDMVTFLGVVDTSEEQPVIISQPESQTAIVGQDATFTVLATGGNLSYYWRFEGQPISWASGPSLTVTNVQLTNAGNYSAIVSNSAGTASSLDALLTVLEGIPAGDRVWSADGSTAGGAGTWDDATPNRWGLSADGPFGLKWNNAGGDNAVFVATGTAPGAITVGAPITVNKIIATNASGGNYSLIGTAVLTFTNDAEFYFAGINGSSTINSLAMSCPVSASVLTKTGGGRLSFSNTGSSIGKFIIKEGIISATTHTQFGAAPPEVVPDYFTIDEGAGIGFSGSTTVAIGPTKGIYLRGNGKLGVAGTVSSPSTLTLNSPISGPGGLSFPGFSSFPGSLSGAGGLFILNNPTNSWEGTTTVTVGELRVGVDGALPSTTSLTLNGGGGGNVKGRLNVNGFNVTVQNVIADGAGAMIFDSVGTGSLTATNYDVRQSFTTTNALSAVLAGNANLTKTTPGVAALWGANTYTGETLLMEGTLELNGAGRFGNGAGTLYLVGTNESGSSVSVIIALDETRTEETILMNPVVMTAAEAQIQSSGTSAGDVVYLSGGPWSVQQGTLYLVSGSVDPASTFTLGLTNTATFAASALVATWTDTCRLASLNPAGTEQTFDSMIYGPGSFRRSVLSGQGGRTIFTAENSYTGGTLIEAGTLLVNNVSGSGTGTGAVTVQGPGGTLAGNGFVGGAVTVSSGGSISAGDSTGVLTLQNGLDLGSGGTNVWDLAAWKDNSNGTPGTDFDQLALAGGELQLGGSSQLVLRFAAGTAPNSTIAFWQASHTWTIVSLGGGQNTANATFGSIVNGTYGAGNFSTSVSGGNILLTFTPSAPSGPHITMQPQSRTNIVGTTAAFTVDAIGSDPLTYKWFRMPDGINPIPDATNQTLSIVNVQAADAGDYFARAYNSLGNDTSQIATLTVGPRPQVQMPVVSNGEVVLSWAAVPGTAYQALYNTNLGTANWYLLTNIVASGFSLSVTDHPPAGSAQRFYRLEMQ